MPEVEERYLTPLHGRTITKPTIGFDVETYGTKNRFVLGCISYPDENQIFTNPYEMLEELSHPRNYNTNIYATNLLFDAFSLFQEVAGPRGIPEGWEAFDNGAKLIWCRKTLQERTKKNQAKYLMLQDSLNLFPLGVYDLGSLLQKVAKSFARQGLTAQAEYYSVHKLDSPTCMGKKKFDSLTTEEFQELSRYCAADAEVTRKYMEWANGEIIKLGANPKITAASTAMDLFRRRFLNGVIPQPDKDSMIQARFSYYGGRTEDYIKGNIGPGFEHDVTAMYPDAMERIAFPYPSPEQFTKEERPTDKCLEYEGFSKITLQVPFSHYPALPVKTNDHLLFPYGKLTGIWTNLHIRWALKQGCEIERIHWTYYNTHTFNPFQGYVRFLIDLRMKYLCPGCEASDSTGIPCWDAGRKCENAHATEEVIKLFLNGLYGKFAQNFLTEEEADKLNTTIKKGGGTFRPWGEANAEEIAWTLANRPEYAAKGIGIRPAIPSIKSFMNPILASYITSAAQVKINGYQIEGERAGIPTVYTDTDSLLCPKALPFAIKGKRLGELQLAGSFDELIIVGPKAKLMKIGDGKKATFKGVPSKSWLVDNPESMQTRSVEPRKDIFKGMENNKLKVEFTRMAKLKESVHSTKGLNVNEMVRLTKEFDPFANPKRRILGKPSIKKLLTDQFDTKPWKLDEKGGLIA